MAWWFRQRYRLAPTDPRYLDATVEEMLTDYWAAYYWEQEARGEQTVAEDEDFDIEALVRGAESGEWESVQ